MTYEQKENKSMVLSTSIHCATCYCGVGKLGNKFKDRYGDVWERTDAFTVRRISDGNVGGWFGGQGLTPA
jgi:hypothetical protein